MENITEKRTWKITNGDVPREFTMAPGNRVSSSPLGRPGWLLVGRVNAANTLCLLCQTDAQCPCGIISYEQGQVTQYIFTLSIYMQYSNTDWL